MSSTSNHIHYHTPIVTRRERFELLGASGATIWFTAVGEAELHHGVAILPAGRRRSALAEAIEAMETSAARATGGAGRWIDRGEQAPTSWNRPPQRPSPSQPPGWKHPQAEALPGDAWGPGPAALQGRRHRPEVAPGERFVDLRLEQQPLRFGHLQKRS